MDVAGIRRHQNFRAMEVLRMIDILVAIKRMFAVECPRLSLAVVDMLKSCKDYLSDLSLVTDC